MQQSDLAKLIRSTQQSVSRWEKGVSRPRYKQLLSLPAILGIDLEELLLTAGYSNQQTTTSFAKPFPVDSLTPEDFERFCAHFLKELFREENGEVQQAGGQGHKQDGIDIKAIFPNKTYTFQCKRTKQFGSKEVDNVVALHKVEADEKYLLLSRIASPKARETIQKYPNWHLWDKEDITREIEINLSKYAKIKLVDRFFPGQRFSLLNELEAGPWKNFEDFFDMQINALCPHKWELIGREKEIKNLETALSNLKIKVILAIGPVGIGKTRLLKEVVKNYEHLNKDSTILFLSPQQEITEKSLQNLGQGKILFVVDNAHNIKNLAALFQYAASPHNKANLLFTHSPYNINPLRSQIFDLFSEENLTELQIEPLTLEQTTKLAIQALKEFGGPENQAEYIAKYTSDCPLAAIIGAKIVAKEKTHFEFIKSKSSFKSLLFEKFRQITFGDISNKVDKDNIRNLLRIIALIQPFHLDDQTVTNIIEKMNSIQAHEINRLFHILEKMHVISKCGPKYRLSPEILADFIIEDTCMRDDGSSTGYAEKLFAAFEETSYLKNILLNLAKIDWRYTNNGLSSSNTPLTNIWAKLDPSKSSHANAIAAAAYYQPARALNLATDLIHKKEYTKILPEIIKHAAYDPEHLADACDLLWQLGKNDKKTSNQHMNHGIQALRELCDFAPNKPKRYSETIVNFCVSLFDKNNTWEKNVYTPFDILKSIFKTQGETTKLQGNNIIFRRFQVNLKLVADLREKVIDATIKLLPNPNLKIAILAARFLRTTITYLSRENFDELTIEFSKTLTKIKNTIQSKNLNNLTIIELANTVHWHSKHRPESTSTIAKSIIKSLPDSLEFRTTLALLNGFNILCDKKCLEKSGEKNERHELSANDHLISYPDDTNHEAHSVLHNLIADICTKYPDIKDLHNFIKTILLDIKNNFDRETHITGILYDSLLRRSLYFSRITIEDAIKDPNSQTTQFSGLALAELLKKSHNEALTFIHHILNTKIPQLQVTIGHGYYRASAANINYTEEDISILKQLLKSPDQQVVSQTLEAIRGVARYDAKLAIELTKQIDISISTDIAEQVLIFFHENGIIPFNLLNENDINNIFKKLRQLPTIDGYWTQTFLANTSYHYAKLTADFFIQRIEYGTRELDWSYRACNYGPYLQIALRFRETLEFNYIIKEIIKWVSTFENSNFYFDEYVTYLFSAIFSPFERSFLSFFYDWLETATSYDFHIISKVLSTLDVDLPFSDKDFIFYYLERAIQTSDECYREALNSLLGSATTKLKTGVLGEPFPRDLELKEKAENMLKELPRSSPAYPLYKNLKDYTEKNIQYSLREKDYLQEA